MSVNHSVNEFYDGSDILSPFISLTGLPIDQVRICAVNASLDESEANCWLPFCMADAISTARRINDPNAIRTASVISYKQISLVVIYEANVHFRVLYYLRRTRQCHSVVAGCP